MSWRKSNKSLSRYSEAIANSARTVVPHPVKSKRIGVEIWYCAGSIVRADVDNIVKPVLDALIGIVYFDDSQVRSLSVIALPAEDAYSITGWVPLDVLQRLTKDEPAEFLINIFEGLPIPGGGP